MEEGSLRCDANISVMLKGAKEYGQRVEVKNMNSIRNVQRAIEHEIERHIIAIEKGEKIAQETRNYNALTNETTAMRSKEAANDYRFFPEPDLQPIRVTQEHIDKVKAQMPPLPNYLFKRYTNDLKLSDYDAGILTDQKEIALYFEEVIKTTSNYKSAANWVMGDMKSYLNAQAIAVSEFPITPEQLGQLVNLIDEGKVSHNLASQKIFPEMLENPGSPEKIAADNDWLQSNDGNEIEGFLDEVIAENPAEVERFKNGEKKLMGFLMGQLMKKSRGKADPKMATQLINKKLG